MRKKRTHHGLALASAATLISMSCTVLAGAAVADPKPGHQDHGKHLGQVKHDQKKHDQNKPGRHGHAHGHAHAPGQQADDVRGGGDPAGNNGTVKIAGPGDAVGHPSNNPHPGCTVDVEWFGFDRGQDVVSTVSFAAHAPTSDVTIGGTSPAQVFVGGDPAGGGTDLDGRQAYTLTFSGGEPHPRQGYHVKLTVATPRSLGNDTKTKVFWIAPCEDEGTPAAHGASSHHAATGDGRGHGVDAAAVALAAADDASGTTRGTARDTTAVPTSVDAGEDGSVLPDWARSSWPLAAVVAGLVLTATGLVRRDRARG